MKPPVRKPPTKNQKDPFRYEKGTQYREMAEVLKRDWGECDPKWWKWQPNYQYRFRAKQVKEMEEILEEGERERIIFLWKRFESKQKVARELKMPMDLARRIIDRYEKKEKEKTERERRARGDYDFVSRFELVLDKTLQELERRVKSDKGRGDLDVDELLKITKSVSNVVAQINQGSVDTHEGQVLNFVTNLEMGEED